MRLVQMLTNPDSAINLHPSAKLRRAKKKMPRRDARHDEPKLTNKQVIETYQTDAMTPGMWLDIGSLPDGVALAEFLEHTGRSKSPGKFYRIIEVQTLPEILRTVEPPSTVEVHPCRIPTQADANECDRLRKMATEIEIVEELIEDDEEDINGDNLAQAEHFKKELKAEAALCSVHDVANLSWTEVADRIIAVRGLEFNLDKKSEPLNL